MPRDDGNAVRNIEKGLQTAFAEAELLQTLEAEIYEQAQKSLAFFSRCTWPIIEADRTMMWNWHHDALCEHLEAINNGQILKLCVCEPPRATKTTFVSVNWNAWTWAQKLSSGPLKGPHVRFLTGAHSDPLATRDARNTRTILESDWFQNGYPHVQLSRDQNQKNKYVTTVGGFRKAFGAKTGVTGEGGDILSMDDPHSAEEGMYSKAERETVIRTWDQQIANRVNDPRHSARLLTMQRLHVEDLVGHVLKELDWELLELPQEYDPKRSKITVIGWKDPRTEPNELLWPERFTPAVVASEKKRLGQHGFAAQHQQKPSPLGGSIIPYEAFRRYRKLPNMVEVAQFWDTAQKDKELNDPWAGGTIGLGEDGVLYIMDIHHDRMKYPAGKQAVKDFYNKHRQTTAIVIEDKSSGSSLIQELTEPGGDQLFPVLPFEPEGDKVMRMSTESPIVEAGGVAIPEDAPWVFDFLTECQSFPDGANDDQVDMFSMALKWFRMRRGDVLLAEPGGDSRASPWKGR